MTREEARAYWEQQKVLFPHSYNVISGAVDAALAALREQEERRWIPVTERLPEDGQKVVFFNYGADAVYAGKFCYIGKRGTVWFRVGKTSYPGSYWMPLPEPPKEGTV